MFFSIPKSLFFSCGLLIFAGLARAESPEIAQRQGLESVWKKSGRTTRVIDYPFSPQPGEYGGLDSRKWGNQGYIFINPKVREYEQVSPLPPKQAPALAAVLGEEETRRQLEEEIARRERAEAELKKLKEEVAGLNEKVEEAIFKNTQLEFKLGEKGEEALVAGTGVSDAPARLVVEKTDTYLVQKDDNLWKISGRAEVYNDPYKWLLLYHANRDQIFEPDLIYPEMILLIPRYQGMETTRPEATEKGKPQPEDSETGEKE